MRGPAQSGTGMGAQQAPAGGVPGQTGRDHGGEIAVRAEGLTKSFGKVRALSGVDLEVPAGTVLGLLGPNGAGKTTTVRILTTLLRPDGGRATVAGCDVVRDAPRLRERIGLAGQYAAVDEILTGRENLVMVGRLYHLSARDAARRAAELLQRFELRDAADRQVKGYSGGMRRRLDLAASLVARPSVLFLDEPTTGLDPRSRSDLWQLIREIVEEGATLLLTTQYLEEADRLADRIAVIDHGRVIAQGTPAELKATVGGEVLELRLGGRHPLRRAVNALAELSGPPRVDEEERRLKLPVTDGARLLPEVIRRLDRVRMPIAEMALRLPTLDDVFLTLTGREASAAEREAPAAEHEGPAGGRQSPAADGDARSDEVPA